MERAFDVAAWVVATPDSAEFLADTLPRIETRRATLSRWVDRSARNRIEQAASPVAAYKIALSNRPDQQATFVELLLPGDDADEIVRRWMDEAHGSVVPRPGLAAWLPAMPVDRQLDLLRRSPVSGQTLTAAARTARLLRLASFEGLDCVRTADTVEEKPDQITRLDEFGIPIISNEWQKPWGNVGTSTWGWPGYVLGIGFTSIAVSQGGTLW